MSLRERERTRQARMRAMQAAKLRREGMKWSEVGAQLGVGRSRAQSLGSMGEKLWKEKENNNG